MQGTASLLAASALTIALLTKTCAWARLAGLQVNKASAHTSQVADTPAAIDAVCAGHDGIDKLFVQALTLCIGEELLMCLHLRIACMSFAA